MRTRQRARLKSLSFQYDPLEPDAIRLLKMLPESTPDDIRLKLYQEPNCINPRERYLVLSYCWEDPTPVANILVNSDAFPVAQNLLDWPKTVANRDNGDLRSAFWDDDDCRSFWVDAICIDQTNTPERNAQVQQMWRIYSNAEWVLSWLGPPTDEIITAFGLLHTI